MLESLTRFFGYHPERGAPKAPEKRSTSLANAEGMAKLLGISLGGTTVPVTDKTILSLSPAWAAIRLISETVASMDLGVYSWDAKNEGYESRFEHPIHFLISSRPHAFYTKFDFLQALIANACLGNGYARIHRGPDFVPVALELLPTAAVTQEFSRTGEMRYKVQGMVNDRLVTEVLNPFDVIHIKGLTMTGMSGERVSIVHRENMSSALAAQKYADAFFKNGAHLAGLLSTDDTLDEEQRSNARDAFKDAYSGIDKVGSTILLDSGLKYTKVGLTPQEAALIDFRNLSVEEASRMFKVPTHMISGLSRATFNNIEQQSLEFRQYSLPPWTEKVEQEFSYKLFTQKEFVKRRAFVMFDYTSLQMADTAAMAQLIAAGVQNGIFKGNEFRRRFKLPQDPDGNRLYIQRNLVPVDRVDDTITSGDPAGQQQTDNSNNGDAQAANSGN